jgi:RNA polymerase primary sigma factor
MVGFDNLNIITILEHQEVCSLDKELGEDGFSLKDTIFEISNQEVKDGKADSKYKIDNLLGKIKPREKMVIEMSYGLTGQQPMTLQEIGDIIGLTREAVRQIKTKALYKLKINVGRFNISFDDFE